MNEFLLLILEKVCEAIYFSMFLIFGKRLKEKRILFTCIMIVEYLLLKTVLKYNIWFNISYVFITYIVLKVLYKEKAQITDIFLFASASIILIIFSVICAMIALLTNNYYIALILNRLLLFAFVFFARNKINNLYVKFYSCWNRHNDKKKIRSLTLRNISIIIFNIMFWALNVLFIICINTYKT